MNTMMLFLFAALTMGLLCGASDVGGCFPPEHACKVLRRHWRHYQAPLVSQVLQQQHAHARCPDFKLQTSSSNISNRSLSPWRYRIDQDKSRIPEQIAVAECLCSGCIIDGAENTEFVSYPVMQTMMVVRKTECGNTGKYSFKTEFIQVPVACTCLMHRSA